MRRAGWVGVSLHILHTFDEGTKHPAVFHPLDNHLLEVLEQGIQIACGWPSNKRSQAHPVPFRRGKDGAGIHRNHQAAGIGIVASTQIKVLRLPNSLELSSTPQMDSSHQSPAWFEAWFDNPHYHQLYGHRSNAEAEAFVSAMHNTWGWEQLSLLDLACGKGRHAHAAAMKGHQVVGLDLSSNSIAAAQLDHKGAAGLSFVEGDMRHFSLGQQFDGILNLFTSFGYFSQPQDHLAVLANVHAHLKPGGFFVLDFLDVHFAKKHLVAEEQLERGGVHYHISRELLPAVGDGYPTFVKHIEHSSPSGSKSHVERVAALENGHLTSMMNESGFEVLGRYGSYALEPWTQGESNRLILHARKS